MFMPAEPLRKKIGKKTAKLLEMPTDSVIDISKITINGTEELSCGGYKGIRLYTSTQIRFTAADTTVNIFGNDLIIKCISEDEITVSGKINSVEFI